MATAEQMKLRRTIIVEHTTMLGEGEIYIDEVPKNILVDVLVLALSRRIIEVDDVPPKLAQKVFYGYVKGASDRIRDDAAERGTEVHGYAEALANGEKVDVPPELVGHVNTWRKWREDYQMEFVMNEFNVYNQRYYYAGTGDFLGYSGLHPEWGLICADYKTSESGIWPDIALQLGAIRGADFILRLDGTEDRTTLPKIRTYLGVQITSAGYQVVPVTVTEATFRVFLSANNIAKWKRDAEKFALDKSLPFVPTQGDM